MLIFNSHRLEYKAPFGAVKTGERVVFSPVVKPEADVTLRLWVNGGEALIPGRRQGQRMVFEYTPESPGLVWYYFIVEDASGRRYYSGPGGGLGRMYDYPPPSYQLTVYDGYDTPEWFRRGVAYQIFPDRFFRPGEMLGLAEHEALGHRLLPREDWNAPLLYTPLPGEQYYAPCDIYGGNLYGVIEKLPYLKSLGVDCIYLNPVMLSSSNHRYNTADYLRVDPVLGGDEALRALAAAAKAQGIRLMLDGVFSHTGDDSVYFDRQGRYGGGACSDVTSPYREWYEFYDYPKEYRAWWGFKTLPEIQELTPSYMAFIAGVLRHYAGMGITSWRLDVADELPDEFIAFLRRELKALDESGVLLGEVWEDASHKEGFGQRRKYVDGHELDSAMCYPFRDALLDFFLGRADAPGLKARLLAVMENYPEPFYTAQLNLLGSHDTVRALTALGGAPHRDALSREAQAVFALSPEAMAVARQRLMSAAALQFTMPGVPCIYYGDEAGMAGMADPFNRAPFPWGSEDEELTEYYRRLSALRHSREELMSGGCAFAAPSEGVLALCRGNVICAVNRGGEPAAVRLGAEMFAGRDVPAGFDASYTDALSGETLQAAGELRFTLPAYGRRIYIKD